MQDNCQKIKLVKLVELLTNETDEQHPMGTNEICERLRAMGITCERRTVTKDMDLLNVYGIEVMHTMIRHQKAYYIEDRLFSIPELKVLIDSVQAATFITEKKTEQLTKKLARLGGKYRAEMLEHNAVRFHAKKHSNETVFYAVDYINRAINGEKRISFRYFDLNENGERLLRYEGRDITVDPMALIYNNDRYYLMAYNENHGSMVNYRIDRMENVTETAEPISEAAKACSIDPAEFAEQTFKMFGGEKRTVTLEFEDKCIGSVFDHFGEGTKINRLEENRCRATVEVRVSPTFYSWVFQFGGAMRIKAPEDISGQFKDMLMKVYQE